MITEEAEKKEKKATLALVDFLPAETYPCRDLALMQRRLKELMKQWRYE